MTEHAYSRAKPTDTELSKLRARLSGTVQPNAATTDILPGSDASLKRQLPKQELSDEQKAAAEHNRRNREQLRVNTIGKQRKAAKTPEPLPDDPLNGDIDPLDDDAANLEEVRRMASAGDPLINLSDVEKEELKDFMADPDAAMAQDADPQPEPEGDKPTDTLLT